MAVPASFDESTEFLSAPDGMTDEECQPLSVWRGDVNELSTVVSCWKLTVEELAEINRTGRVWLGICGQTMPPAWITGTNPFR
jgi:hypothetical protein